ncbi:hypothetical protein ICU_04693 [Bacillus cereus BAG2X1-1]|nr:hypothetical protein ICU_04693 [Bacillus cereus BAG2X1-1]
MENEHLVYECKKIEEDALYSAETHFQIAGYFKKFGFWAKFIPALVTAISGTLVIMGYPKWVAWFSILGALATTLGNIHGVDRSFTDHTSTAKEFKTLQHAARYLYKTKQFEITREEFFKEVNQLRVQMNELIKKAPQTNEKYFYKARKKIKQGVHVPDFDESADSSKHK